jgi:hypothetical protein
MLEKKVLNRHVKVSYISTAYQIIDVFTKGLTSARFNYLKSKLKVIPSPFMRGHVKHTIHPDDPADVPAIQQTSNNPVNVSVVPTLDDPAVHTVDVPAASYDYARAHPLERSSTPPIARSNGYLST